jgi:integrase
MRRRRFQNGGLSQRKRRGRLYWYLQWRENGQSRSKELGLISEITRAHAELKRPGDVNPNNKGILKPTKPIYTFERFIEDVYLPVKQRRWKVSTAMTTETVIRAHLIPCLGCRLLEQLTREDLQGLLDRTAADGLSYSVVDHMRWQLRSIFQLAMGDGVVSVNPTLGLTTPRCKDPGKKPVMSELEVYRALKVLPIRERLIFRLATIEGMRPGEILGLQLQDLGDNSVHVTRRVYRGNIDSPKTGRSRVVGLSPCTASLLSEWRGLFRQQRREAWLFESENPKSPLIRDNVQRRHIQPKLAKVGLHWVTFQVMRRTNASLGEKDRVNQKVAADQRGHGMRTSLEVYVQAGLDEKLQAAAAIDSLIQRVGANVDSEVIQ